MAIEAAYIVPHPPLAMAEVGRGEEAKICRTLAAFREVARRIAAHKPDTIVFLNPHSGFYSDWIYLAAGSRASGDMAHFGAGGLRFLLDYDEDLSVRIAEDAHQHRIPAGFVDKGRNGERRLDHGVMVPLYFITKELPSRDFKAVSIGGSGLDRESLLDFGACIARATRELERKAVIVASGDLSHKLLHEGPYGYDGAGPLFDEAFCEVVHSGDPLGFATIDPRIADDAAECGLSGFIMMAGALREATGALQEMAGALREAEKASRKVSEENRTIEKDPKREWTSELLSYEGPFGVGYGVAAYELESNKRVTTYERNEIGAKP